MSLASHASEKAAAELDYDHPDDEGNWEPVLEGWFWPGGSRKAHYFVHGRSLCGKWGFPGELEPYGEFSSDDCAACARKAKERHER